MKPSKSKKIIFQPITLITEFVRLESSSGILLFLAAVLAMILANSGWRDVYESIVNSSIHWGLGFWDFHISLLSITNEALMAIFFLLVGLEIKREIYVGELNTLAKVILPGVAALGGMVVPALIYIVFNWHHPQYLDGWAIPTATDIAFALGVMALLGNRVPLSVKLFLMALAIFDDLGAIVIITLFYQSKLKIIPLIIAGVVTGILFFMNWRRVNQMWAYVLVGILLWLVVLESGIHPTIAGVLVAFSIPVRTSENSQLSLLHKMEKKLHPWVAYGVLPLFSFANAGIPFYGVHIMDLITATSLGIIAGLWIGKQVGIMGATWLVVRSGLAPMPDGATWRAIYGTSLICGIGFTMSLFIGNLAFAGMDPQYTMIVRFGVFVGSILSGISGYFLLRYSSTRHYHGTTIT